jgi:glycosyltransferase involved in cell wall biosynthesis
MKIAVYHSFLDNIGGAEMVTLSLARGLGADIYTTSLDMDKIDKMGFGDMKKSVYSIGKVPKNAPFRHQLALTKFRFFKPKERYDATIICGDWAISGSINANKSIWYTHSPLHELWFFKDKIKVMHLQPWQKPVFEFWTWMNRFLTKKYVNKVDFFISNSVNTSIRLKKYYGKESVVINPPIDTSAYKNTGNKKYWLSVNRIVKQKRIDLQIEAFENIPDRELVIVGSYEKGNNLSDDYLKSLKSKIRDIKNVKIIHWATYEDLINLYANCTGFITTSNNEDFGMTVIEALASGKPVIAPDEGGYTETLSETNQKTGILIKDINKNKIIEAVRDIESNLKINSNFYTETCQNTSKKYDVHIFINKMKTILDTLNNPLK